MGASDRRCCKKIFQAGGWGYIYGNLFNNIAWYIFIKPGQDIALRILLVIGSAGSMVAYTIGWAMIPDCIGVDEFKTGQRREGLYYGIITVVQKGGSALITFVAGIALQMIGYSADAEVQSAATAEGLKNIYTLGSAVLILISFFFVIKYPLSRARHKALVAELSKKNAGEAYDEHIIDDLIIY